MGQKFTALFNTFEILIYRIHSTDWFKLFLFTGQPIIIFKADVDLSHEPDEVYNGNIHADELKIWAQEKCIPLVRLVKNVYVVNDNTKFDINIWTGNKSDWMISL